MPCGAAPLIRDGVTPETADEIDQLAIDIASGQQTHAVQVIDRLVTDGALVDPSRAHWHQDPTDPTHTIVTIHPDSPAPETRL